MIRLLQPGLRRKDEKTREFESEQLKQVDPTYPMATEYVKTLRFVKYVDIENAKGRGFIMKEQMVQQANAQGSL